MTNTKRTKKVISWLLSLIMVLAILLMSTHAVGEYTLSEDGTLTIMTDISYYTTMPWQNEKENIKEVVFQVEMTALPERAFYNCTALESIVIPDSVTSVSNDAFRNCTALESIVIPDSVTSIGNSAFYSCEALESIEIPDSVTSIGNSAFQSCSALESIVIPDSVTSIGSSAFYSCDVLSSVTFEENSALEIIGNSAFQSCSALQSIVIPDSVTSIGNNAFAECDALEGIAISDSVTSIGNNTFYSCDALESIVIPNSVTSIGDNVFYSCDVLSSVTFEENSALETIGNSAFGSCTALESIEIPDSVTSIGNDAFHYCEALESIVIPNSVTSIGNGAFQNCDVLSSVTFEENSALETIGNYAFGSCTALESIVIPDSVTSIGNNAFDHCTALESIVIPDSVTSVSNDAFRNCTALESIEIPDSVTSIGESAFGYCEALKSIEIPDSVTLLDDYAFGQCRSLTDIYYEGTSVAWEEISKGYMAIPSGTTIHTDDSDIPPDLIITGGTAGTDYYYVVNIIEIIKGGTYDIKNANPLEATSDTILVAAPEGTVNITLSGVNIVTTEGMSVPAFEITGDCTTNITLADGTVNILNSRESKEDDIRLYAGLQNGEHPLTISCEHSEEAEHICDIDCGSLEAVGGNYAACIGGGHYMPGKNITINGGNITANSQGHAGIGGGYGSNGENITITGGNIVASSGGAAGIGSGGQRSSGSNITISGGTVTATSTLGSGIGGGDGGSGSNITITGGTVTATSALGSGIGGGDGGNGSNITISGGTVTATSEYGAGIGGGEGGNGSNITISGGNITANSQGHAGIGGGENGSAENIKIAPAANMEIYAYNGSDDTGTALDGSPFTCETDITNLLSGKAFYSYTEEHTHNCTYTANENVITGACSCGHSETATIIAPTENLIYDGTAKEAFVDYSADWQGGELAVTYSEGGNINAGNVMASIGKGGASARVTFEIAKAQIAKPTADTTEFVYDGSEQTYVVAENDKYEISGNKMINAGSQDVTVALEDKTNFEWTDGTRDDVIFTFTIAKATPTAVDGSETKASKIRKNKKLSASAITGGKYKGIDDAELEGTYEWKEPDKDMTADSREIVVFTPTDTNYAPVEIEVDVDVTTASSSSGGGGGARTFNIQFETNGGSYVKIQSVEEGDRLKEPEEPVKEGYSFIGWYEDKELNDEYDFSDRVTKGFTLYAKWDKHDDEKEEPDENEEKEDDKPDVPEWENPFTDVSEDDWFYGDVEYAVENGLFNGTGEDAFSPDEIITRAMMVTVLYRAEGEPEITGETTFLDVEEDAYYAKAVLWAQQNGIIKGYSETEFAPEANITREQIAAIMHRYAEFKGYDVTQGGMLIREFEDYEEISEYALTAMTWTVNSGLLNGKGNNKLAPKEGATRAEIAAILHRFIEANK